MDETTPQKRKGNSLLWLLLLFRLLVILHIGGDGIYHRLRRRPRRHTQRREGRCRRRDQGRRLDALRLSPGRYGFAE